MLRGVGEEVKRKRKKEGRKRDGREAGCGGKVKEMEEEARGVDVRKGDREE